MKTFYKSLFLVVLCCLCYVSSQAQNKKTIYLGTVANVTAAYKTNLNKANAAASISKISYAVPGQAPLALTVKQNRKEGAAEVFSGQVGTGKNNYFFLKVEGKKLAGYIILKDQKIAYEYSSSATGAVYLQEVNIDKVLCLEYQSAKRSAAPPQSQAVAGLRVVPNLQSLPGAKAVIYLDFDGEKVNSIYWNGGREIDAEPADLSESEIIDAWKLISEDYRPFALNVTTSETVYNNAPANRRMRIIFTPTDDAGPGYGGVAYVGSFTWGDDTPCWVFNSGVKGAGEAGSHEAGHTLGLSHDGRTSPREEYFNGQGGWAPIMGVGYFVDQVQWSKGEYSKANNDEDDLEIITTQNGFGYRPDDYSNSSSNARPLVTNSSGVVLATDNKGIINNRADVDVFSLSVGSGSITLHVSPSPAHPNLDILLTLKNSAGTTVATANPDTTSASLTPTLSPGTYYLYVAGTKGNLGADSDYSSLGEYTISGNLLSSYCTPVVTKGCTDGDYINDFKFNTLVNNGSGCNGRTSGYIAYPTSGTFTTSVNPGQSYSLSLKAGPEQPQGFGVWIDYNNDNDFNDVGEFVYQSPSATVGVTYTGQVTIPSKATPGQRRLRVRAQYNTVLESGQSCEVTDYGETEDYTITIGKPLMANEWNLRYGGSGTEGFSEVIKTTDGGYLLAGYSASGQNGDKSQTSRGGNDYWVLKTDAAGKKVWDQRYGGQGHDFLNRIIQTHDGGYLLAGSSESGIGGDKSQSNQGDRDYWIVKISSTGVKQWDKRFGGSEYDELKKVTQLSSGEYLLAGSSDSPASGDKSQGSQGGRDYWLVKVSRTGTKLWDKRYGGNLTENLENFLITNDGGFLLGGASTSGQSGNKSQAGRGGQDFWLVRTDANGLQLWDRRFGGSGDDHLFSMGRFSSGEFFVAGYSASGNNGDKSQLSQGGKDFWMLKISSSGSKIWDKRFGGSHDDELRSIIRTADGGFLLAGKSASGVSGDKSQGSQGNSDYWLVKTTSSGSKQWDRRFGGSGTEELRNVLTISDGSYLLGGRSDSGISGDKTQNSQGGSDYWLVKIDAAVASTVALGGQQASSVLPRLATSAEAANMPLGLAAYPNPFADQITISFTSEKAQSVQVQLYNSQGQLVTTLHQGEVLAAQPHFYTWQPARQLASGIYVVRVITSSKIYQQKIMLQR